MQFTVKEETAKQLPFLDMLINRWKDWSLETMAYCKVTNTPGILSFNHPLSHKKSCIRTQYGRTHCSTQQEKHPRGVVTYVNNLGRMGIHKCLSQGACAICWGEKGRKKAQDLLHGTPCHILKTFSEAVESNFWYLQVATIEWLQNEDKSCTTEIVWNWRNFECNLPDSPQGLPYDYVGQRGS